MKFHLIFHQIGPTMANITVQNTNCHSTCPEDCPKRKWLYKRNNLDVSTLIFDCATYPKKRYLTESVQECLEDFDVNKHPNRRLLPKTNCGKQITGMRNSV